MEMHGGESNCANSRYIMYDTQLSKIISFENVKRSLVERTAGTLLRPVVIDGPLIGISYDEKYTLDDHIGCLENYVREVKPTQIRRGFRIMKPYPMQALVKLLFYFIARGHKTTAFLPVFFDERLDESSSRQCALVSDLEQFRELILLKLIKFLPDENFAIQLKYRTADCHGILVTSAAAFYFNSSNLHRNNHSEESITSANAIKTSYDLVYNTMLPEMLFDNSKLPVIIPLFRPYNHRLIISLDVVRWKKVLQVKKQEANTSQYKLLVGEQLTLQTQFQLLSKLVLMLDDQFPCGPPDAEIIPLFRHALGLADQAVSSMDRCKEGDDGEQIREEVVEKLLGTDSTH
ncbi:Zc3h12a-like Ribonuclease NYN domain family protein [Acanthocheilonema viteae]